MDRFVTLAAAVLDPTTHVVTLVNAGHVSPLLYHQSPPASSTTPCRRRRPACRWASWRATHYESCQVTLEPGDSLLLFSDGVHRRAQRPANEPFGLKGIHAAVLEASGPATPRRLANGSSRPSSSTPPAASRRTTSRWCASARVEA